MESKYIVSHLVDRSGDGTRLFEELHGLFSTWEEAEEYAKDKNMVRIRTVKIVKAVEE